MSGAGAAALNCCLFASLYPKRTMCQMESARNSAVINGRHGTNGRIGRATFKVVNGREHVTFTALERHHCLPKPITPCDEQTFLDSH
ncbi:hypothetical protein TcasGA2_TC000262 [Tribolium castaneum]|uniref:Uncharacterized protein n=1 Tax=Tribolium castaneum TaxID=7070 RepID=D6WBQ1_TRICA|nr:hypothetical protein TcasGA2_TC000262 [Tribolium castaneum]